MIIRGLGCLAVICILLFAVVAVPHLLRVDVSIPWAETKITLPDDAGHFVYRQKGVHRAMVTLNHGATLEERWLPWRPYASPVNVYYYSNADNGKRVRLQDLWHEVLIDLQKAKTYLLVKTRDGQIFMGEILSDEVASSSHSIDHGPWTVEVGNRRAQNISSSEISTNRGQYIGRIEVTEPKDSALGPPLIRFISVGENSEQVIDKQTGQPTNPPYSSPAAGSKR